MTRDEKSDSRDTVTRDQVREAIERLNTEHRLYCGLASEPDEPLVRPWLADLLKSNAV